MIFRVIGVALIICSVSVDAAGSLLDKEKLAQGVSALFAAKAVDNTTPGCAIGVIENGGWALLKSYGMANLEHNIPITSQSIFRTGSLQSRGQSQMTLTPVLTPVLQLADFPTWCPGYADCIGIAFQLIKCRTNRVQVCEHRTKLLSGDVHGVLIASRHIKL